MSPTHRAGKPRVALYVNANGDEDAIRRALLAAGALSAEPMQASVLVVTGETIEGCLPNKPDGADLLVLAGAGGADRREDRDSLHALSLRAAVEAFEPDALILICPDPSAADLAPTLEWAHFRAVMCLFVLPDVPSNGDESNTECVRRALATPHSLVVLGDRRIYDVAAEHGLSRSASRRIRYAGYLSPRVEPTGFRRRDLAGVCLVRGANSGVIASAFARTALAGSGGRLILTEAARVESLERQLGRAHRPNLPRVLAIEENPGALDRASAVVCSADYASVCDALSSQSPLALVYGDRDDERIRAERFEKHGIARACSVRDSVTGGLGVRLAEKPTTSPALLDTGGMSRFAELVSDGLRTSEEETCA